MAPCSAVFASGDPSAAASSRSEFTSSLLVSRPTINTMSVIEELSMGTRMAWPFSLPFNSGKTSATAVADPVEVGAKFSIPLRARRRSFFFSFGMSTSDCVPVMLCTVVIMPFSIVSFSWITLMMGAMQLVVQEAAVQMMCDSLSLSSLHPMTTFSTLGSLTGADTTTRFTPHRSRYGVRLATVRNLPVQSITSSTPLAAHGTWSSASTSEKAIFCWPSTVSASVAVASISCDQIPCTESYLAR
mmetsp:Transcript_42507/g.96057  ORF Transcript_42507/g.96057 Transcript_42507/m.96057 type:complete len:244 (+) Transcript_42507:585-1316(+)